MKRFRCWLFGHPIDDVKAEYTGVYECTRCGEFDPDQGVIPLVWFRLTRWLWGVYSWVFVPCRWCGRFGWDPRGHKSGDGTNEDDHCIPF